MKLSRQTELIISGVLIAYLAFTPGFQIVRDILAHPIGRVLALAGIVYVFKFVSASIALLLLVGYIRCIKMRIWEGADDASMKPTDPSVAEYKCKEGDTYAPADGKCRDKDGKMYDAVVICETGWAYDESEKKCKASSSMSEPVVPMPPPVLPAAGPSVPTVPTSVPAPSVSTAPVTSPNMPMTTPSATPPPAVTSMPATGPTPTETFLNYSPF
jgi:hypothetical protein